MLRHDLNAVVDGLLTAGDHEIWVYDMHYYGRNLDMRRVNQRLRVICGKPHYLPGNVGGLTAEFDGQILLGLDRPAADVSRGANAHDILGVAAIVGVQAIEYKFLYPDAGNKLPGE